MTNQRRTRLLRARGGCTPSSCVEVSVGRDPRRGSGGARKREDRDVSRVFVSAGTFGGGGGRRWGRLRRGRRDGDVHRHRRASPDVENEPVRVEGEAVEPGRGSGRGRAEDGSGSAERLGRAFKGRSIWIAANHTGTDRQYSEDGKLGEAILAPAVRRHHAVVAHRPGGRTRSPTRSRATPSSSSAKTGTSSARTPGRPPAPSASQTKAPRSTKATPSRPSMASRASSPRTSSTARSTPSRPTTAPRYWAAISSTPSWLP